MKTFTIRPYFGHDCNSHDGFNNGCYLDDILIEAEDEYAAVKLARLQLLDQFTLPEFDSEDEDQACIGSGGDTYILSWITDYSYNGESISKDEYEALLENEFESDNLGYLYQYIDFQIEEA